ncbi:hypothetical protein PCANC_24458 [Puccinia coronata f. sp. avenae]|uniref:HAT C-terminal dimerisation domain-containing protein n=1 Tax=Puccinia coronata f. sp. avenae TaxID=200324 RepID=A0A2N5S999_9BASI|nr:hypothetical protein PCANC_24458 [Puccinia coronata f. sp. avenae]
MRTLLRVLWYPYKGVQGLHACPKGVQALHTLQTGVQALHACTPSRDVHAYCRRAACWEWRAAPAHLSKGACSGCTPCLLGVWMGVPLSSPVIATILHPGYRMHIFDLVFGIHSSEAKKSLALLQKEFQLEQEQQKKLANTKATDADVIEIIEPPGAQPTSLMDRLALQMTHQPTLQENEIETYLKAKIPFKKGAIDQKTTPLKWWKVNQTSYPTLAVMVRAYLGASGSSCSVERLFSAASDVCSSCRGSLLPSSMLHCVSSLMWLREEVPLTGEFAEAGKALKAAIPTRK